MLTAIILAAGRATRMGTLKQLLPWEDGKTILETVVQTVLACPEIDDQVRVVLGAGSDKTAAVLADIADPRLQVLDNPNYLSGMLSSIKLGTAGLPTPSAGFMIALGDQPLIKPEVVELLTRHWLLTRPDFLIPVHNGRRGHPVIISSKYLEEIAGMDEAQVGLRDLIRRYPGRVEVLNVDDPAIHIDLDYPEDYQKYRPGGGQQGMKLVVIRGAGEMASGTAHRLYMAGFRIIMSELPQPLAVRRNVSFAQAVLDGSYTVEGVTAQRTESLIEALALCQEGKIAVYPGEIRGVELDNLRPVALVDAMLAKANLGTKAGEAPVVIALGPGFTAPIDADAVIETNRGHDLGRVLYAGSAAPNTSQPGETGGYTIERVLKAPGDGVFSSELKIGDIISPGDLFGRVGDVEVKAVIPGIVRGLLMPGTIVQVGTKLGDIDPRYVQEYCDTISDKARSIAGGVLEALLYFGGKVR